MRNSISGVLYLIHLRLIILNDIRETYEQHRTTKDTLECADMKWTLREKLVPVDRLRADLGFESDKIGVNVVTSEC